MEIYIRDTLVFVPVHHLSVPLLHEVSFKHLYLFKTNILSPSENECPSLALTWMTHRIHITYQIKKILKNEKNIWIKRNFKIKLKLILGNPLHLVLPPSVQYLRKQGHSKLKDIHTIQGYSTCSHNKFSASNSLKLTSNNFFSISSRASYAILFNLILPYSSISGTINANWLKSTEFVMNKLIILDPFFDIALNVNTHKHKNWSFRGKKEENSGCDLKE